jgi:hypothetical protein
VKTLALAALSAAALVASANAGYIADVIAFNSLAQWQSAPSDPKLNLFPGHTAQFYTENFNDGNAASRWTTSPSDPMSKTST